MRSGTTQVGFKLPAVGYGSALAPVAHVAPTARANRVLYRHSGVSEWYANGPLGVEQGFTIPRALTGRPTRPLTLTMALSGTAQASLAKDAEAIVFSRRGNTGPSLHRPARDRCPRRAFCAAAIDANGD